MIVTRSLGADDKMISYTCIEWRLAKHVKRAKVLNSSCILNVYILYRCDLWMAFYHVYTNVLFIFQC